MSFDFGDGRPVLALFMKARPGLVLRTVTDKHGRAVRRWMRPEESGSRQGRQKAPEADARRDNTPVGAVPVQFGGQTHHIVLPEREPLVMFHDSPTSEQIVINDGGLFGGIFAGPNGGMGASNRHVVVLDPDKVLSQHDLEYEIPYEETVAALRDAMPWLDDDDLDLAYELIIEEKDMYADPDEEEDILRVLRETDLGEAGWEAQRIRGAVAKRLGYQAVEMADETGTSYLVLPGAQVFPLKNKERGLRLGEASDEADEAILEAWRKHRGDLTKSIPFDRYRASHEPTEAQLKAGTYKKPRINFQGLRIAIENPAGSVRSGKNRDGKPWEVRMIYPYGYIERSEGVDGDQVDCYVGPNPNADLVYIVHQRKYGAWDEYDEDKVMLGFDSEEDAKAAYLQHYNDPRFLGPITVMPIEEFKQKVRATREQPAMIKGMVLFFKARVGPYFRRGKLVNLAGYERKGARPKVAPGQLSLFSDAEKPAEKPAAEQGPKAESAAGKREKRILLPKKTPSDVANLSKEENNKGESKASSRGIAVVKVKVEGRRAYIVGDTYPYRGKIRAIGAHWDSASKRWWTGKKEEAEKLVAEINAHAQAESEKRAEARANAPVVQPGTYGPFTVRHTADPNKYAVSFRYDPELVSAVKSAKSAKFRPANKEWLIDKADGEKLLEILEQGKAIAAKKAKEAERRKAEKAAKKEEMKRQGISYVYYWADRRGYGLPSEGQVVKRGNEYHVVTDISRGLYMEDAMSFGGTDERSYQHRVTLRRATEDEVRAAKERESAEQRKVEAGRELKGIAREIQSTGTRPDAAEPKGDILMDTFNAYGGGERIVVDDDKIWYIMNNGSDGANWSQNNVRTGGAGAIGWYVPKTPELEARLRQAVQDSK